MCYKLPMKYYEGHDRDDVTRKQITLVEPVKKLKVQGAPRPKSTGVPPDSLHVADWTAEQTAAWAKHVRELAQKQVKDIEEMEKGMYWAELPSFTAKDAEELKATWQGFVGLDGDVDRQAVKDRVAGAKAKQQEVTKSINSFLKVFKSHFGGKPPFGGDSGAEPAGPSPTPKANATRGGGRKTPAKKAAAKPAKRPAKKLARKLAAKLAAKHAAKSAAKAVAKAAEAKRRRLHCKSP